MQEGRTTLSLTILVGRLTDDPAIKYFNEGKTVKAELTVVTGEKGVNPTSKKPYDTTEFHKCFTWGTRAEHVGNSLVKGSLVHIDGHNETSSWEKDGVKHYKTEVVIDHFIALAQPGTGKMVNPFDKKPAKKNAAPIGPEPGQPDEDDMPF